MLLIGSGGSGKTTLARQVAERTGIPLVHLDQLYWRPGWVPTPDDEWDRVIASLIAQPSWIMDGNYGRTLPQRMAAADTIVFLDVHPLVCAWRIVKRRWQHRGGTRYDVAPGCPERLTWEFMRWVLTYRRRRRPDVLRRLQAARGDQDVFILSNYREVDAFLTRVAPARG